MQISTSSSQSMHLQPGYKNERYIWNGNMCLTFMTVGPFVLWLLISSFASVEVVCCWSHWWLLLFNTFLPWSPDNVNSASETAVGFCLAVGNLPGPLGQCQWPAMCVHWCGWRDHAHSCDKTVESSPQYWPACLNTCPHIAVSGALGAGGEGTLYCCSLVWNWSGQTFSWTCPGVLGQALLCCVSFWPFSCLCCALSIRSWALYCVP